MFPPPQIPTCMLDNNSVKSIVMAMILHYIAKKNINTEAQFS